MAWQDTQQLGSFHYDDIDVREQGFPAHGKMSDFPTSPPSQRPSAELGQSVPRSLAGIRRLSTSTFSSSNHTVGTPHPSAAHRSSTNSVAQVAAVSGSGSRSVTQSSYRPGRRGGTSTASGRKTQATSSIWGSDGHQVICAVSEARGVAPSVGLAFVNLTTNEAILSQICDSQFYVKTVQKIQIYDPATILIVNTAFPPNPKSTLLSILEEELQGTSIEPLDRRYWSEAVGLEYIHGLAFREDIEAIEVATQGNFYATCSFAAAVKYMEHACHLNVMPHSLRVRYQPSENSMMIDMPTIHSLELIQNLQNPKSKFCLFGLLNDTLTPMGSRMLRSNILQPSTQVEHTLSPRLDALDELTTKEDMFFEIRTALKEFTDVEKLLTKLVIVPEGASIYESELAINHVLMIKNFVSAVPTLHQALSPAHTNLLKRVHENCRPELIQPVADLIANVINDDVRYVKSPLDLRHQRTFAVKSGVHAMLDVARQTYREGTDDVHDHAKELEEEFELPTQVRYDQNRKYWFRVRECDIEGRELPDVLINRVRKNGYLEFQTMILVQLNNRITDSHNESLIRSDGVIHGLLDEVRGHIANLFRVCEGIALLDMLSAFGKSSTTRDYIRPEFTETLALKAARHPIAEWVLKQRFVPNDVYATELHRFQIITGCNMSGKSMYTRTIPLLQIMAQIGCFVPAEYASFLTIEQLFVRISTDDSIEANMSSFSVEMRDVAFILRNINARSLTIIDELGRGTSTRDGLAIALAISEALIQSNSLVWFATHFNELAKILESRPGVLNLHLETDLSHVDDDDSPKMTMLHKVASGYSKEQNYGLQLSKAIGFPYQFIHTAETVSDHLKQQSEQRKHNSQSMNTINRRRLLLHLYETLRQLRDSDLDSSELGAYVRDLQYEFVVRMDEIENGGVGFPDEQPDLEDAAGHESP